MLRAEGSETSAAGPWGSVSACPGLAPALLSQEQCAEPGEPRAVPARSRSPGRTGRYQAGPTAPGRRRRNDLGVQLVEAALPQALRCRCGRWAVYLALGCSRVPACGGST